jgi:hypothetical protein
MSDANRRDGAPTGPARGAGHSPVGSMSDANRVVVPWIEEHLA